jgi:hypothetical protein
LKHGLKVEADMVSAAAREKIEKAGGTITLREEGGVKSRAINATGGAQISAREASSEAASPANNKKKSSKKASTKSKSSEKKKTARET